TSHSEEGLPGRQFSAWMALAGAAHDASGDVVVVVVLVVVVVVEDEVVVGATVEVVEDEVVVVGATVEVVGDGVVAGGAGVEVVVEAAPAVEKDHVTLAGRAFAARSFTPLVPPSTLAV